MVETPKQQIELRAPGKPETTRAPKLNFCIRKLRRIVTNFIYLRTRVCIIDCTVIHVCRRLVLSL